ncbi:MAG: redoxin domain-containing protein [Candidatus Hydrogenedens sp.]|nr:redoxin domain-containing protein [Candidatus Hydrogenedens sp.]
MGRVRRFGWILAASILTFTAQMEAMGEAAEDFRLLDQAGVSRALYHQADRQAVVLFAFASDCPVSLESAALLQARFPSDVAAPVVVWGINVRPGDSRDVVASTLTDAGLTLPILMDPTLRFAHALGLSHAGETLVLNPSDNWKIVYRGAADAGLEASAGELLSLAAPAEQDVVFASSRPAGAPIAYPDLGSLSYADDIAPILESKCVTCHDQGGMGPFAMSNYEKVQVWASMMRETIRTGRMPPWHADEETGPYLHDRSLTVDEEQKLLAWIEQGAVNASDKDPLAGRTPPEAVDWQLGEPDHIVRLPEVQQIEADGIVEYRYISVPSVLSENRWLRGVEVRTSNPKVVHHALIFVNYPRDYRHMQPRSSSGLDGYFASFLPGAQLNFFPEGSAMFLPHDTVFLFQMHYNTTGKPEEDMTELGLYFQDAPPEKAIHISAAHYEDFIIPPHVYDQPTQAKYRFRRDATILGLSPHMHYRGSRFKFAAVFPEDSGRADLPLLNVPFYEFDWQPMYFLEHPIDVPEGTVMQCNGAFNNSRFNPKNPYPEAVVAFGEQSMQEMFIGYVMYTTDYTPEDFEPKEIDAEDVIGLGEPITAETLPGMAFKIGPVVRVDFHEGGIATAAEGIVKGTWEIENDVLTLGGPLGTFKIHINYDELVFRDDVLKRLQ